MTQLDEIEDYVSKSLKQARDNQENPMFWSGHSNGEVFALEGVLVEIKRLKKK